MKFETFMLHGLFIASLVVCSLILAAMVTTSATMPAQLTHENSIGAQLLAAPSSCALPPDGVVCPRVAG